MAGDRRAGGTEYAERVNAAADLLASGAAPAEAARVLAARYGCSERQARRYADRAAAGGRAEVAGPGVVLTVRLPGRLAAAIRAHARESGRTISAVVAQALEEFLARGRRDHSRG